MHLYHDPSHPYLRPSLVGDLLGVPATSSHHQLENQTTTVLAWLIDRSPGVARAVLELRDARAVCLRSRARRWFHEDQGIDKYWLHRRLWPLEGLVADNAAREIVAAVRAMGLLHDSD